MKLLNKIFTATVIVCSFLIVTPGGAYARDISVASFNIKFLGLYGTKENEILANIVSGYDIVFVQELVAPPYSGKFPDGSPFRPDQESAAFFDAMSEKGFKYVLSPEDTGTATKNHNNGSATEWSVVFYKSEAAKPSDTLPSGFLETDRSHNPHWDRVPYAFAFKLTGGTDAVFISVHLRQGSGPANRARRKAELGAIRDWINAHDSTEKDFMILGDMNLQNCDEIGTTMPTGFTSLNADCKNTNVKDSHPFDDVLYRPSDSEIDTGFGFKVDDLTAKARTGWGTRNHFPSGSKFEQAFSDHNPVHFQIGSQHDDD